MKDNELLMWMAIPFGNNQSGCENPEILPQKAEQEEVLQQQLKQQQSGEAETLNGIKIKLFNQ
jgi:hypothetical protein